MAFKYLNNTDPDVARIINAELTRQRNQIELIASENIASPAVMEAMGTVLTNKYAEGYPGKRYYGGCEKVDLVEDLARDRACELFGAAYSVSTMTASLLFLDLYGQKEYRGQLSRMQAINGFLAAFLSALIPYMYDLTGSFLGLAAVEQGVLQVEKLFVDRDAR